MSLPGPPSPTRSYTSRLRLDLPFDARTELARLALEQHRSAESQAVFMLEQMLRRSSARRQTIDVPTPA
jgi:hypothetical protein